MLPVFPLGVKKDLAARALAGLEAPALRSRGSWPRSWARQRGAARFTARASPRSASATDIAPQAGRRGRRRRPDGRAADRPGRHQRGLRRHPHPELRPESRGGTSYADVRIAEAEVLSPAVPRPHVLVAFNAPSLAKFGPAVAGVVVYDRSVVTVASGRPASGGRRPAEAPGPRRHGQVHHGSALHGPCRPRDVLAAIRQALGTSACDGQRAGVRRRTRGAGPPEEASSRRPLPRGRALA